MRFYSVSIKGRVGIRAVIASDAMEKARDIAAKFLKIDPNQIIIGAWVLSRKDYAESIPEITINGIVRNRRCPVCDTKRFDPNCHVDGYDTQIKLFGKDKTEEIKKKILRR